MDETRVWESDKIDWLWAVNIINNNDLNDWFIDWFVIISGFVDIFGSCSNYIDLLYKKGEVLQIQ